MFVAYLVYIKSFHYIEVFFNCNSKATLPWIRWVKPTYLNPAKKKKNLSILTGFIINMGARLKHFCYMKCSLKQYKKKEEHVFKMSLVDIDYNERRYAINFA